MADPSPTGGGTELGRFLRARRAQISPADVGLPVYQGIRRTPGLRREELASLDGSQDQLRHGLWLRDKRRMRRAAGLVQATDQL
jgi:hypothetical protein